MCPASARCIGDVAWGGNWFFLVRDHGETLDAGQRRPADRRYAWRIRAALTGKGSRARTAPRSITSSCSARPPIRGADSRNFVLCPGRAYDRSPCGTGTSAKLACLAADGKLEAGEDLAAGEHHRQRVRGFRIAGQTARSCRRIAGQAYVNAEATLILDPADPFALGHSADERGGGSRRASSAAASSARPVPITCANRAGRVTLIDQGEFGRGSSHANCGFVCPSHVLPLAEPGVVCGDVEDPVPAEFTVRRSLAARSGALALVLAFARRCNGPDMIAAGHGIQRC